MSGSDDMDVLIGRYYAGIEWLQAHDPLGAFYLWYQSGIRPHHPMPAQASERREEFRAYVKAYELWVRLDKQLLRLERQAAKAAEGVPA